MVPYSVNIIWSDEDESYFAAIPELPGLTAFGDTQQEAMNEALEIAEEMIAIKEEYGEPIPEPLNKKEYSGQTRLRLPKSLHGNLSRQAEIEGLSLNSYLIHLLTKNYTFETITKIHRKEYRRLEKTIEDNSIIINYVNESTEENSFPSNIHRKDFRSEESCWTH
ncbi:MAG: type II toxin-antitoxin system HicB family antitoxin [Desulfohalobiaceae bacterium]|nr:type II toxin-antitoxin system HicB family antitoxin [Desulfohalobiaceae bacterium]